MSGDCLFGNCLVNPAWSSQLVPSRVREKRFCVQTFNNIKIQLLFSLVPQFRKKEITLFGLNNTNIIKKFDIMTINRLLPYSNCLNYPIYSFIVFSRVLGILPLKVSTTETKCSENDSKTRFKIQADEKITCSVYIVPWCIISRLSFFCFWFLLNITYLQS